MSVRRPAKKDPGECGSRDAADRWILALDTAGKQAFAALTCDGEQVDVVASASNRAEDLPEIVSQLLKSRGLAVADLAGLAVVEGPGSYTGLRVGLALARGLALVDRIPVVALGSLELAALACPGAESPVACLLPAAAGRIFFAVYGREQGRTVCIEPPEVVDLSAVPERLAGVRGLRSCCAEARETAPELWRVLDGTEGVERCELPRERAGTLARVGLERLAAGQGRPAASVVPLYVGTSSPRKNRNRVVLERTDGA